MAFCAASRAFRAYLGADHPATIDRLSRFRAHGAALQRLLRLRAMPLGFAVGSEFEALPVRSMCNFYCITKNQAAIRDMFKIGAALAGLILGSTPAAFADDLTGQASVIDGDTLEIHGTRTRLWGVDAPESSQLCRGEDSLQYQCGAKAANELDAFIASRPVSCLPISLDRYGRTVATCLVGGADLGDWLVRNGLALDWPQYSKRKYDDAQREAEQAGRGMWAGSYVEPWLFRVCFRQGGKPSDCSDDANAHP
jgi:endonuclease YncB( thermonuclease family)